MPQKKFATIYAVVIGIAVIALIIAFYHPAPQPMTNISVTPPPVAMVILSPAFMNNGDIPAKFTCDDKSVNPELDISGVPQSAKSLALILHDPDAPMPGGFTHWVMWNIPVTTTMIGENSAPAGSVQGENGSGKTGYIGPCPPSGTHHYHFMLYALDSTLNIATSSKKADLESAMQGHIITQTELVGLYAKVKK
jgi:Raf kinase inhibitor-like YbhB/YbcL family protein